MYPLYNSPVGNAFRALDVSIEEPRVRLRGWAGLGWAGLWQGRDDRADGEVLEQL